MKRGRGGQVVRVLAFYSDDSSLNPAEFYRYFIKLLAKLIQLFPFENFRYTDLIIEMS